MGVTSTKALIIADPWIGYLLDGTKTWEMRESGATHRGWFGLIRKGTGAVHGVARLVDVGTPLSPAEMIATFDRHRIPESMIRSGEVAKWNTPWKLADVRRLARPVPYVHKSGAVTWVALDAAAMEGIAGQLGGLAAASPAPSRSHVPANLAGHPAPTLRRDVAETPAPPPARPGPAPIVAAPANGRFIGQVTITEANITHNHIYLRPIFDRFPADAVGGSNKASPAPRSLTIDWGGPETVITDLDGSKKFFRARGWIGAFYKLNRAEAGDQVLIEQTAPYEYRVTLQKSGA